MNVGVGGEDDDDT